MTFVTNIKTHTSSLLLIDGPAPDPPPSKLFCFFKATLTALESQTEAREKEEGGELQGAIYVHHTVGHVTQVVMHLLKKCIYIREHTKRNSDEEQLHCYPIIIDAEKSAANERNFPPTG